jgi:transposase
LQSNTFHALPREWVEPLRQQPDEVRVNRAEGAALSERLEGDALTSEDRRVLVQLMRLDFWLLLALQEARCSLKRLRRLLLGDKRKKRQNNARGGSSGSGEGDGPSASAGGKAVQPSGAAGSPGMAGAPRPGHGRQGAAAYVGADRVVCRPETRAVGARCPVGGRGRLYRLPAGLERRLDGHALVSASRYALAKLRCSACGAVCTAKLPGEVAEAKSRARARAVVAVGRDDLGLPFHRREGYQAMLGVPRPDATQWELLEQVGDSGHGVVRDLEGLAAQGALISQDDTAVRMLSLVKEHQGFEAQAGALGLLRSPERTGMYTTALVVQVGERTICLYYSGRSHAGANLAARLQERPAGRARPLVMSEALSSNEADEAALIRCPCLAHGRRKFSDLEAVFPHECQVVLEALRQVLEHDEVARHEQREGAARLASHQAYSGPIMAALKTWLTKQGDDRLVEPNSALGKAIAYMQGHWETRTRFLSIPGAPIDNNLCERSLKLCLRQRKHSLLYNTESRAYVARVIPRLMAPCLQAGVNAVDSLVALQEPRHEVFLHPAGWLPWNSARGSPYATFRQSVAMAARSGAPFHTRSNRSRAHKGRCASAEVGHHVKRP